MKKTVFLILLAMISATALSACNTVEGAGRDIKGAGDSIEDAAADCKDPGGCGD